MLIEKTIDELSGEAERGIAALFDKTGQSE
jgi:hypothetical protein